MTKQLLGCLSICTLKIVQAISKAFAAKRNKFAFMVVKIFQYRHLALVLIFICIKHKLTTIRESSPLALTRYSLQKLFGPTLLMSHTAAITRAFFVNYALVQLLSAKFKSLSPFNLQNFQTARKIILSSN